MNNRNEISIEDYRRMTGRKPILAPTKVKSLVGRPSMKENPVKDSIEQGEGWCRITLVGNVPGLNQMLREHFMVRKKRKEEFKTRLLALKVPSFTGKVGIVFKGYSSVMSDWENFSGKFKTIGDALVDLKIIEDDSPKIIASFIPQQVKCRRKDAKIELTIKKR